MKIINKTDSPEAFKAIVLFVANYQEAVKADYIRKPVSWALYQTWQVIDKREKTKDRET